MITIATIDGCEIREDPEGGIHFCADADIDADGDGDNPHHDRDFKADTSLHIGGMPLNAEVDRYIVVPLPLIRAVQKIVLGCQAFVVYRGICVDAVVGDVGPSRKLGELSIACAEALEIDPNPNNGGVSERVVHYLLFPGRPARVGGVHYKLQAWAG